MRRTSMKFGRMGSVALLLLAIGLGFLPAKGQSTEEPADGLVGKKQLLYIFSSDFPPHPLAQYPSPPIEETRFRRLLDREIAATPDLALTDNPDEADYRIELRCSGVLNCSRLVVDIQDADRVALGSFSLNRFSPLWGLGSPRLEQVAHQLTLRLDERLKRLEQGDYGHTH